MSGEEETGVPTTEVNPQQTEYGTSSFDTALKNIHDVNVADRKAKGIPEPKPGSILAETPPQVRTSGLGNPWEAIKRIADKIRTDRGELSSNAHVDEVALQRQKHQDLTSSVSSVDGLSNEKAS